jgi:uncharacterized protein (TIGR03437 family)
MVDPHCQQISVSLPDGGVLIVGSTWDSVGPIPGAEVYDPVSGAFSQAGVMTTGGMYPTATLLNSGKVLITGGVDGSTELYTPRVLVPAPVLYSLSGDGRGQGAIWNGTTGQIASAATPASAGEVLSMYTTSLLDPGMIPPQVAVGGRLAEITWFGPAPGYRGYNQVNFRVPVGITPGPIVPVRLAYLNRTTNEVTIAVQ